MVNYSRSVVFIFFYRESVSSLLYCSHVVVGCRRESVSQSRPGDDKYEVKRNKSYAAGDELSKVRGNATRS